MKYRVVMICMLGILLFVSCSSKDVKNEDITYYNAYESIAEEDIMMISGEGDIEGDPSNPKEIYDISDIVIIATIQRIDGGSNQNDYADRRTLPYTYGKLIVHQVIKGNLEEGDELDYLRTGGIISYNDYVESLYPAQKEKQEMQGASRRDYIKYMWNGDIEIEPGKTYLIYMNEQGSGSREGMYPIIGWQGGLREVQSTTSSSDVTKIYNNYTEQWEEISDVLDAMDVKDE